MKKERQADEPLIARSFCTSCDDLRETLGELLFVHRKIAPSIVLGRLPNLPRDIVTRSEAAIRKAHTILQLAENQTEQVDEASAPRTLLETFSQDADIEAK
jgi:hypothetical protein